MNLDRIHSVYFIGIGGIGMSALAKYFLREGKKVAGYDRVSSPITLELEQSGVNIVYGEQERYDFHNADIIVYTPAVAPDSKVNVQAGDTKISRCKRSEVLGAITRECKTFAVAGTHGKTTTAAILTRIVEEVSGSVIGFIGGKSLDYNSNFVYRENAQYTVIEADEYDRSFLQLNPEAAVVTSVDVDHLDVYGNEAELRRGFHEFCDRVKDFVVVHEDAASIFEFKGNRYTYGFGKSSNFRIENLKIENGRNVFDLAAPGYTLKHLTCRLPGRHNVENAAAAAALCLVKFPEKRELIKKGLNAFKGVERRFEIVAETEHSVYIDDYAHHPKEIKAALAAARDFFPNRELTAVFQPHLFSRTRDMMDDFAAALLSADKVMVLPVYAAREKPIHGVSSSVLTEKINEMQPSKARLVQNDEVPNLIKELKPEVLMTLGAGDIDQLRNPIKREVMS